VAEKVKIVPLCPTFPYMLTCRNAWKGSWGGKGWEPWSRAIIRRPAFAKNVESYKNYWSIRCVWLHQQGWTRVDIEKEW